MKTTAKFLFLASVVVLLFLQACSTTERGSSRAVDSDSWETVVSSAEMGIKSDVPINPTRTLLDHLRRIPGLTITGNHIQVRGPQSINRRGGESPLFVINNVPVGNSYEEIESLIYMENVLAINLYRGGQAHRRFGPSAAYGAIVITTK